MLVVWLEQPDCQTAALTGGKASHLSRLAANYPVPPGFCLTTQAYASWTKAADPAQIPSELQPLLASAYATLTQRGHIAPSRMAVRSSAIGEDGHTASFAGQYDTYLNLTGLDAVSDAVMRCWASAQAPRIRSYRSTQGVEQAVPSMAVLVQQLIPADVSFVAFSAHPITGCRDEVVINANWGLGESIVSGAVTPDTYVVRKSDWTLATHTIAEKRCMTIARPSGVEEVAVPRVLSKQAVLTADQARAIAQLAARLQDELHWPVDIEGAYHDGRLYLLQCRPITALAGLPQ